MPLPAQWTVIFQDDFEVEFDAFSKDVQDQLIGALRAVQIAGPSTGRPHVAPLTNPKHPNMKELRFDANNGTEVWRAAFAFDRERQAVVLVAADKQGATSAHFYKRLLAKANKRFDAHLESQAARTSAKLSASQRRSS